MMLVKTDIDLVKPLRCPRCNNTGEASAFSAGTFVLIKEQGLPILVADYSERVNEDGSPTSIECHECDYEGPLDEFQID